MSLRCTLQRSVVQSYDASFQSMRTYHDLTASDRSGLPQQIAAQRHRVAQRLAGAQRVMAGMSWEGGGGWSYVTARPASTTGAKGRVVGGRYVGLNVPGSAPIV